MSKGFCLCGAIRWLIICCLVFMFVAFGAYVSVICRYLPLFAVICGYLRAKNGQIE
jgi:hypothetical protein